MSKHGEGSWSSKDDGGSGKFGSVSNDSKGQSNYYVGNESSGSHCHMWNNKATGETGTVHRGECKDCDDKSKGGSSGSK